MDDLLLVLLGVIVGMVVGLAIFWFIMAPMMLG